MKYFIYCRKSTEAEDRQALSLEGQDKEIQALVARTAGIEVVDVFTEAKSAKTPGRAEFNRMVDRIKNGEAQGVISWHPDRLARNSMDGGQIIFLLDQGLLHDLKFCSYSFENSPQGKFMLGIMFSNSKYYSDSLSVNVKRGMQLKLDKGWKPGLAPIGYKNCKETGTIVPDPKHFKAVRSMFDLLLAGHHTPSSIHRVACNQWNYTTPKRKSVGGKQPAVSTIYKILSNPFYSGFIRWKGQLHSGNHKAIVSKEEFEKVQRLLGTVPTTKAKRLTFPYTGLFKCGACGLSITAEKKIKPSDREYTYYHCTRVHRTPKCTEPSIEGRKLDAQVGEFLDATTLHKDPHDWLCRAMRENVTDTSKQHKSDVKIQEKALRAIEGQMSNLTDLRLRDMITDAEFLERREGLQIEVATAKERLEKTKNSKFTFEPVEVLSFFLFQAKNCFEAACDEGKRRMLDILCSNPSLKDQKALLKARKPLVEI
jgi:DNA invertase Pin-like site-specific DNA recombinase